MIALSVAEWLSAVEDLVIASSHLVEGSGGRREAGVLSGRGYASELLEPCASKRGGGIRRVEPSRTGAIPRKITGEYFRLLKTALTLSRSSRSYLGMFPKR